MILFSMFTEVSSRLNRYIGIRSSRWWEKGIQSLLVHAILIIIGITFLVPFVWQISTSLKTGTQIWLFPPKWIPDPFVWSNYPDALQKLRFLQLLKNTVVITGLNVFGVMISSSLVAYGFARFRFPGRGFIFVVMLSTMMIPAQVTIVPLFILFNRLNWLNTIKPLVVPLFFGAPFFIFLLRQFYMTIPRELDEAAVIDGCGYGRIWTTIILPLSKPAMATVAIFQFVTSWNDFFNPLIYLNEYSKYTLALGLSAFRGVYSTEWNLMMAAAVVIILPCLVLFFLTQRYFIQGITLTGLKG